MPGRVRQCYCLSFSPVPVDGDCYDGYSRNYGDKRVESNPGQELRHT